VIPKLKVPLKTEVALKNKEGEMKTPRISVPYGMCYSAKTAKEFCTGYFCF